MAYAATPGGRLFWRQDGASARPPLLLIHPALTDHSVWDRLVPLLVDHFRLIRVDLAGHGASPDRTTDGSLADIADDLLAVLNASGTEPALVCGLSQGAAIALMMAARQPHRVSGVVAAFGAGDFENQLGARGPELPISTIVDETLAAAFTADQNTQLATWLDPLRHAMLATSLQGYRRLVSSCEGKDLAGLVNAAQVPVALMVPPDADFGDPAALPVVRSSVAGIAPIAIPGEFATLLGRFHDRLQPDGAGLDPARNGERVRREVLGDMWVDRSLAARDAWIADYQDYATEVAWHTIWGRKGLDYRTRRLIVLALTSALGRWEEFRFHVRLGIERGSLTVQDVKEVSLQTGLYAGVPVSNTAFVEARAILKDLGITFPSD